MWHSVDVERWTDDSAHLEHFQAFRFRVVGARTVPRVTDAM